MSAQVARNQGGAFVESVELGLPVGPVAGEPVDEHERGPAAATSFEMHVVNRPDSS